MGAFKWWTSPPSCRPRADRGRALLGSCLVLTLSLPVLTPPALALPNDACIKDERCKEHYDKGVNYYSQQYYEEALSEFQAAYAARQMALLLINIGRTMQKLGRPKEALSYYERFQQAEASPDPAIQAKLTEYMAQVKALIGSQPATSPGESKGVGSSPLTAPPPAVKTVAPPPPGKNLIIAGSALAGVGVLGLITGIGLYARSASDYSTFNTSTDEFDQQAAKSSAQSFGTGSTVSYIVGAAFVGAGATLIALGTRKLLLHRRAAATPAASPTPAVAAPAPAPSAALLPGGAPLVFTGAY